MELIKEKEIEALTEYLKEYVTYNVMDMREYLKFAWAKPKENLIKLFRDQLIYSKEINLAYPNEKQIAEKLDNVFTRTVVCNLFENIKKIIANLDLLYKENNVTIYKLCNMNNYINNRSNVRFCLITKEAKKFVIDKNSKWLKMMRKLIFFLSEELMLQNNFSQFSDIITKCYLILDDLEKLYDNAYFRNHLKGTLYISIHPIDYFTLSDNNNHWTSCYSITNNRSHVISTLELLSSPDVVVAYFVAENDPDFYLTDDFTWYNKNWRSLIVVDKDALVQIKGYPYQSDELNDLALDFVAEIVKDTYQYNRKIEEADTKKVHVFTHRAYNDYSSTCSHVYIAEKPSQNNIKIATTSEAYCLECGNEIKHSITSLMLCENCGDIVYCCNCGEPINFSTDYYAEDNNGNIYCEMCEDSYLYRCAKCNYNFTEDDINTIYYGFYEINVCNECYQDLLPYLDDNNCLMEDTPDEIIDRLDF